jgi:hypothetical protein
MLEEGMAVAGARRLQTHRGSCLSEAAAIASIPDACCWPILYTGA